MRCLSSNFGYILLNKILMQYLDSDDMVYQSIQLNQFMGWR